MSAGRILLRSYTTVAVFAVALAGCGGADAETSRNTLVAAIDSDPGQFNPAITTNGGVHTAADLLYNGLVGLDEQQQPVPELAVRWSIHDDGRRYRFYLRPNVQWHDGRPFTAADVEYSFNDVLLRYHARTRASLAPALASVAAVDDSTIEFRFHQPYAPLLQQLNVVEAPILPRHLYASTDPLTNPHNRAPVGTGPFRFAHYRPDAEIRLEGNQQYFGGAPHIEALVLRVIPDATTQILALEAGQVDWLFSVPGAHRHRLRRNREIRLYQSTVNPGGSNCIATLAFNLDRPALQDVRVRRAIAHAIDRKALLDRVQFGEGSVAGAPISSRITFARAPGLALPAYDTAAARSILAELHWPVGRVLNLKTLPSFRPHAELIRAQLRAVGIDTRIQLLEQAVFVESVFTRRDFDMAIISYCNGTDPQIGVRRQYASSSIGPVPFSNAAGYRSEKMDSLFEAAGAVLDTAVRRKVYATIQELAVSDLPYVWLLESEATRAHRKRCGNFGPAAHFAATARCK